MRRACLILMNAALTVSAFAQPSVEPASVRIEAGGWNYVAVVQRDGDACIVESIAAFADPAETTGDNLVAVWYTRDGAAWLAKSWSSKDRWSIVEQIKADYGMSNSFDYRWGVAAEPAPPAAPPVGFAGGVLESDPLAGILASDPEAAGLVQPLVQAGYAAANPPTLNAAGGCETGTMLDDIAESVEGEGCRVEPSTLAVAELLDASGFNVCVGAVSVISDRPMGPPGPWTTPTCTPFELAGCEFFQRCNSKRTQNIIRTRTKTCTVNGAAVTCTQSAVLECQERNVCRGPSVPGYINPAGACLPPATLPAAPAGPCGPVLPNVPLLPAPRIDPSVPANCTVGPIGWIPSGCPCP